MKHQYVYVEMHRRSRQEISYEVKRKTLPVLVEIIKN